MNIHTKRIYLGTLFLLFTGLAGFAYAEPSKIGFVNSAKLMTAAPQSEAARKLLKDEFAPRDEKIVKKQKELKKLEEDLSKNSAVMSSSVRTKNERMIVTLKRDIKRSQEEFSEDLNLRRNEELSKLQKTVYNAIVSVAKAENFDVILGDSVLYASQRIDITDKVLEQLQQDYSKPTQ
ncbi:MAG: OmpH family outer membrane protein [Proteobacteria bacterium]|jgi:outer membrane protein|nr:OmpH family outer membrane protein [Pseudomonadota bacterium]